VVGKARKSNARLEFEMGSSGQASLSVRVEEGLRLPSNCGEEGGTRQVLEPDQTPWTLVIVLHKEAIN
jgi:hypothetical protein